jgi:hypothetical protein
MGGSWAAENAPGNRVTIFEPDLSRRPIAIAEVRRDAPRRKPFIRLSRGPSRGHLCRARGGCRCSDRGGGGAGGPSRVCRTTTCHTSGGRRRTNPPTDDERAARRGLGNGGEANTSGPSPAVPRPGQSLEDGDRVLRKTRRRGPRSRRPRSTPVLHHRSRLCTPKPAVPCRARQTEPNRVYALCRSRRPPRPILPEPEPESRWRRSEPSAPRSPPGPSRAGARTRAGSRSPARTGGHRSPITTVDFVPAARTWA